MFAYNQGKIDYFCAVYAVINSVRLAAGKFHYFNYKESCNFYQHLLRYLYDNNYFLDVLYNGTSLELMNLLLKETQNYLSQKYKLHLHYKNVIKFKNFHQNNFGEYVENYLKRQHTSCILRLYMTDIGDHWSVVQKRIYNYRLKLFDSYSYPYIDTRKLTFEPYRDDGLVHLVKDSITFIKIFKA